MASASEIRVRKGAPQAKGSVSRRPHTFDVGTYASRKTFACGLMDIGLLSANTALLRNAFLSPSENPMRMPVIALLFLSMFFQTCIAIILVILYRRKVISSHYAENLEEKIEHEDRKRESEELVIINLNNIATALVTFVTVLNVVIGTLSSGLALNTASYKNVKHTL